MAQEKEIRAIGRRKAAVARVVLTPGKGPFIVNDREPREFFKRDSLIIEIEKPMRLTDRMEAYTVKVNLRGGGVSGQAHALRLGLSRALSLAEPSLRGILKKEGLLTRDARIVERKKYGRKGARRRFQFTKR